MKLMLLSRRDRIDGNVEIGELEVESVHSFKYLGSTIMSDNQIEKEITERIGIGNRCAFAINKVMTSRHISQGTKLQIYKIIIRPTVLYGCETWTLTKGSIKKLEILKMPF